LAGDAARSLDDATGRAVGTLYVVSTPIGHPDDISLRALQVLGEVDTIVAEDTRVTRRLLDRHGIGTPLEAYRQNRRATRLPLLVERLLAGERIALVSDAGTPVMSDPGGDLVARAVAAGVSIVPVPGPAAVLAALVASGLPAARFVFDGFPPRTDAERHDFFAALRAETRTLVFYESPRRLRATLRALRDTLGERRVVVARDLTKPGEAFLRGAASEVLAQLQARAPVGESVLVVEGFTGE
jgi:16S rRNA (cytidine1402-2'-O)-methyltransferase